ncbi:ABC-type transport system involved in multi-copper enzyme maturation, permease component [Arthrobacter subterraneus]|uniref:ABC-type transport system involved in multi-copper enzyme maturation, permease component n=1 Tax=Arthrobacter subterraneus TaxID=335973 RepID=A0A1G8HY17_9MICC|nr:ABC transporter permease subunit [Arthrobacter subterraneus]SDI11559.1 ABC-type transport system involved in multi-copper enzyme maturation, permease component [Arthrobacter subterraneus]
MSTDTVEGSRTHSLGYVAGVRTVFGLEMKQRLRGRAWYIMMAVWFLVIGLVFLLATLTTAAMDSAGPFLFDLVVGFVLFFGLLVAPGLSANAINGDRTGGTLAILQVTLLRPGQILWGKWLASWVASLGFLALSSPFIFWALALGGVNPLEAIVSLAVLALELGLVCALGVGISALAGRPLFSIVTTYMMVALLGLGTLIAFGLSMSLVMEEDVQVTQSFYDYPREAIESGRMLTEEDLECLTNQVIMPVWHTERTAWLLAANPFVIVADAVPYDRDSLQSEPDSLGNTYRTPGVMESISAQVRLAQAGPDYEVTCEEAQFFGPGSRDIEKEPLPIWPLGLVLQGGLAAAVLWAGRRRLVTPVRRLARGTRIA